MEPSEFFYPIRRLDVVKMGFFPGILRLRLYDTREVSEGRHGFKSGGTSRFLEAILREDLEDLDVLNALEEMGV